MNSQTQIRKICPIEAEDIQVNFIKDHVTAGEKSGSL
jgi:hypothetical protein